jgi:hypothetical protein
MEKVITDIFMIISLILGTGVSARWVHDETRILLIKTLTKKQPSLSSYTKKLTSQK